MMNSMPDPPNEIGCNFKLADIDRSMSPVGHVPPRMGTINQSV